MANQPKKYKKFVSTAATATLVASAIVPVASAASFTDVPEGNEFAPYIDALTEAGIINGYTSTNTFKPSAKLTRGQVVKMLGRWVESKGVEIPTDWNTKQRFNDVPTNHKDQELVKYAALVADQKVFTGAAGKLMATNNITRQQMAKVLNGAYDAVNGESLIEIAEGVDNVRIPDLASAGAEFEDAIQALMDLEISSTNSGNFRPLENVTRAQFSKFLYNTINFEAGVAGVTGVTAINATTVEVDFEENIEDINSLKFTVEGLTVTNAVVKQTDKSVAVLTTSAQEGGKEYTVTLNGEKVGKFKGVSAVIPTSINFVEYSNQSKVGNEITLKADIGVKEAGVPVTFNVDAPAGSLNTDKLVEVYTNAEGIATFSYTQYAADVDTVTAYPTGAASVRTIGKVYWGVADILVLEQEDTDVSLANGEEKTYKVTYRDPQTGKPIKNAILNVTFLENVNVKPSEVKKAVVGDPHTDWAVTPSQTTDGEEVAALIETDSDGVATFTVSGTNTAVTPIVWLESDRNFDDKNETLTDALQDARLDSTELQTIGKKVTFKGAQENHSFGVEGQDLNLTLGLKKDKDEAAAGANNGRKYTVTVKDKDGKAYAGGIVNVALEENIDGLRSTETGAKISKSGVSPQGKDLLGSYVGTTNKDAEIQLRLDKDGKAEFFVYGEDDDVATPVIWVDQNDAQNTQIGVLEDGEPTLKGATTNFETSRVVGAILSVNNSDKQEVTIGDGKSAEVNFVPVNQSGNVQADTFYDVTYVVKNTGSKVVTVKAAGYEDGTGKTLGDVTLEVGGTVTLHRNIISGVDSFTIEAKNGGSVSVRATGVTEEDLDSRLGVKDARINNLRMVPTQVLNLTFTVWGTISSPYTAVVADINKEDETITFAGKNAISYAGAKFLNTQGVRIDQAKFEELVEAHEGDISVTYTKDADGNVTFEIVSLNADVSTALKSINEATDAAGVLAGLTASADAFAGFATLTEDQQEEVAELLLAARNGIAGKTFSEAQLVNEYKAAYQTVADNAAEDVADVAAPKTWQDVKAATLLVPQLDLSAVTSDNEQAVYTAILALTDANFTTVAGLKTALQTAVSNAAATGLNNALAAVQGATTNAIMLEKLEDLVEISDLDLSALSTLNDRQEAFVLSSLVNDKTTLTSVPIIKTKLAAAITTNKLNTSVGITGIKLTDSETDTLKITFNDALSFDDGELSVEEIASLGITFENGHSLGTVASVAYEEDDNSLTITLGATHDIIAGAVLSTITVTDEYGEAINLNAVGHSNGTLITPVDKRNVTLAE